MKHFLGLLWVCCLLSNCLFGQSRIQKAIETFSTNPAVKNANWGFCVIDVNSGAVVASHKPNQYLIPASSLKVLTTATALSVLGPNYTFRTEILYDGLIDRGGTLNGNLYIKGFGDPTLGSSNLKETPDLEALLDLFRTAIQNKGIKKITGYVVGDGSYYGTASTNRAWQWSDIGNYYGAGVWGLNIHDNLYYLRFKMAPRLGETPQIIRTDPTIQKLEFRNEIRSAARGSGDNAYIFGSPHTNLRFVRGTIPMGNGIFSIKGSVPNPPLLAAELLWKTLERSGISVNKGAIEIESLETTSNGDLKILTKHRSPAISTIVEEANMKSVNLYCEALLRALAKSRAPEAAYEDGLKLVKSFWENKGLRFNGCSLYDGSGLSYKNLVTPFFMAKLMQLVNKEKAIFNSFYDSLPMAGRSGTLKNRFRGTRAIGKISAKTGTLNRIRSFTGYAKTSSGKLLAFSFMVNNYTGSWRNLRPKVEQLLATLCY